MISLSLSMSHGLCGLPFPSAQNQYCYTKPPTPRQCICPNLSAMQVSHRTQLSIMLLCDWQYSMTMRVKCNAQVGATSHVIHKKLSVCVTRNLVTLICVIEYKFIFYQNKYLSLQNKIMLHYYGLFQILRFGFEFGFEGA